LRWAKEREEQLASQEQITAADRRRMQLVVEEAELAARAAVLKQQIDLKRVEIAHLATYEALAAKEVARAHVDLREKRGADSRSADAAESP